MCFGYGLDKDFRSQFCKITGYDLDDLEKRWLSETGLVASENGANISSINCLKLSKNLRVIQKGEKVLVYNAFYGHSLIAGSDILQLLEAFNNGTTLSEIRNQYDIPELEEAVITLKDKKLLVFSDPIEENTPYRNYSAKDIQSGQLVNKLRLNVSTDCNMRCAYCYVDHKSDDLKIMSWETAQKALEEFFELQSKYPHDSVQIRFFGGEPLLNWTVIEKTLDYVEALKNGTRIEYILNTNGTIANEQIAEKLAKHNVYVLISLDGIGEVHDCSRKFKTGKGSFKIIDKNMDIFLRKKCCVGVETTLDDHTCQYLKDLIDFLAHKADTVADSRISLGLQNKYMIPQKELDGTDKLDEQIHIVIEAIKYAKEIGLPIGNGMIHLPFNAFLRRELKGFYCGATGGSESCVFPNGEIHPCGALKIKLGTLDNFQAVFASEAYKKLVQRVSGNLPGCRGCDIEGFCAGGCAADAESISGSIFHSSRHCDFEKSFFKALVENFVL